MYNFFVYILSSKKDGVLYVGVTNDLVRRINEHKQGMIEGFTKKYFVKRLVYYEKFNNINEAILREKTIKGWIRGKKIELIESINKEWNDLSNTME